MSLHHFFLDEQVIAHELTQPFELRLSTDDTKHARVLRLQVGEHISVVDAAQDYFELEISEVNEDHLWCCVCQHEQQSGANCADLPPLLSALVLVQGLAKGDKFDTVVRQATEVGASAFLPVAFERSVVRLDSKKAGKRVARWQAIARSSAMQAGRRILPQVKDIASLNEFAQQLTATDVVLVCWEEAPLANTISSACVDIAQYHLSSCGQELANEQSSARNTSVPFRLFVVIGPEGGIAPAEMECLRTTEATVYEVSLGPTILRTETACVVALALVRAGFEHAGAQDALVPTWQSIPTRVALEGYEVG